MTIFVDANLKRTLDGIATPRLRLREVACKCGAKNWRECDTPPPDPAKIAHICCACGRRRTLSRVLMGVVSAVDGSGVADGLIQAYLRSPVSIPKHVPTDQVKLGIFMRFNLHAKAKALAEKRGTTLSSLLASIIAARVQPERERAA